MPHMIKWPKEVIRNLRKVDTGVTGPIQSNFKYFLEPILDRLTTEIETSDFSSLVWSGFSVLHIKKSYTPTKL